MKKILLLLLMTSSLFACNLSKKDYVTVSGTIKNAAGKTLTFQNKNYSKEIKINSDGTFKDTLQLKYPITNYIDNFFGVMIDQASIYAYLKNGYELNFEGDATNLMSTINVTGEGSENATYIKERIESGKVLESIPSLFKLNKEQYTVKIYTIKKTFDELLKKHASIDKDLLDGELKSNNELVEKLLEAYDNENSVAANMEKGAPSPTFSNYENYKGGKTSLNDLKGKYVYIDIWATWCAPCRQEIPYLQELEKKFHGKNIEFVSISTDNPAQKSAWKKMIQDKKMSGIQLFAGNDQQFSRDYQVTGIPRFILIDPSGNIVDANAPRPSDPSLVDLFTSLGI